MAIIYGTNGHDRSDLGGQNLIGTAGNDRIYGLHGNDWLEGLDGHDLLDAGSGNFNTVKAGNGDDVVLTTGYGGWFDGGAGVDMMIFDYALLTGAEFDLAAGSAKIGDGSSFTMSNFESLYAAGGNDVVRGSDVRNILSGGGGHDDIQARGGNDVVYGGQGDDTIEGGGGADDLRGEAGHDDLIGGSGNDTLDGGDGHDLLWGGTGNEILKGGRGNDTLDGGESGYDTASYASHGAAVTVDIGQSNAWSIVNGVHETDTLFRIDKVIGSSYGDQLVAGTSAALEGGAGNDSIWSGSGANVLAGGSGVDTLSYGGSTSGVSVNLATNSASGGSAQGDAISGFENLSGSTQADVLTGSGGANTLYGNAGDDDLWGAGGADNLIGGHGADDLWGGSGADRFIYHVVGDSVAGRYDTIRGFSSAQGDKIDVSSIDANLETAGNGSFWKLTENLLQPGYSSGFVAGTINVRQAGFETIVELNTSDAVDASGYDRPEMVIHLEGVHELSLSDFIL